MNKLITISSVLLTATAVKAQSPNVIFILADDLGYGDISAFNPESKIHTPNIDNLTHSGISFTDAHSSSALSTPSRYSIITGRYPWRTTMKSGVLNGFSPAMITPDRRTIAQMFSENGYNTACIGKWHLGWDWGYPQNAKNKKDVDFSLPIKNGPTDRGFDYFYGIPSSLDIAPYVYVENNKVTALPDHIIEPQKGLGLMHGGVAGAGFDPQYTGRENIYLYGAMLGYSKSFIEEKFDEIVEFSELKEFIDVPIKNYSSGMKARLGFSIATLVSPDILILDEVLSVGDAKFRKKSEKKVLSMFDKGVTVLFVSHSLQQVQRLCNKAMILEKGKLIAYGDIDEISEQYEKMID